MKLQIGKTYVTRNRKHRVKIVATRTDHRYPFQGVPTDGDGLPQQFTAHGKCAYRDRRHLPGDLIEEAAETPKPVLEIGGTYETRNGQNVRILCTDAKGTERIIGLRECSDGTETPERYEPDGHHPKSSTLDIVRESRPKVPWHQVPPYMRFWAVDRDNGQCYFSGKPAYDPADGIWRGPDYWRLPKEHRIPYAGKPENSLTERPSE